MRPELRMLVTAGLATALFWFGACRSRQRQSVTHTPTTLASTTQMGNRVLVAVTSRAAGYEYIMPEEQQRRILREAPLLREGDSVDEAVRRLGPPLRDDIGCSKETGEPILRCLEYYFAKHELNSANNSDPCLQLFFAMDGRLENMASGTPSIPSINWPPNRTRPASRSAVLQ